MIQVNTENGYASMISEGNDLRTLMVGNMEENTASAIEMSRENVVELRRLLWGAIRRDGRGYNISAEDVVAIEEVQHKPRYSVSGYTEEIEWTIRLLESHLKRIEGWKEASEDERRVFGKLDAFLSQFEEM